MESVVNSRTVLIVENDPKLRDLMVLLIGSRLETPVLEARTQPEALRKLEENPDIACVVAERSLFQTRIPSSSKAGLVILSMNSEDSHARGHKLPFDSFVRKPFEPEELIAAVQTFVQGRKSPRVADESEYYAIRNESLASMESLPTDIYLPIGSEKLVRVAREGDSFAGSELARFRTRGLEIFYIRKQEADTFARELARELHQSLANDVIGFQTSYRFAADTLAFIQDTYEELGIPLPTQKLIRQSIEHTVATIRRNPTLAALLAELELRPGHFLLDHSVILAHVACGVAALQIWAQKRTFEQLTAAALLHDITLRDGGGVLLPWQMERYPKHPEQAAKLAREVKGLPPDVDELILQHHEKPDGTGFPAQLTQDEIRPLVCAFLLAHEIVDRMYETRDLSLLPARLNELTATWNRGHFRTVLETVRRNLNFKIAV